MNFVFGTGINSSSALQPPRTEACVEGCFLKKILCEDSEPRLSVKFMPNAPMHVRSKENGNSPSKVNGNSSEQHCSQ